MDKENKEDTDYIFVGDKIEKSEDDEWKKIRLAKGIAVAGAGVSTIGIGAFGISKLVKSSGNDKINKPSPEINPESDKPTGSEEKEKEPEKKDEPSPETNPEPDKPTDPKKEEKEPEKNPSEKPKEEEKVGFVEWFWTWCKNNLGVSIPLTIISLIIARMIYFELWQQIGMYKRNADGIYLDFALKGEDKNIKPVFGLFKYFTKKGRFTPYNGKDEDRTIMYRGLDRWKVNFLAAVTFAGYSWHYSSYEVPTLPPTRRGRALYPHSEKKFRVALTDNLVND